MNVRKVKKKGQIKRKEGVDVGRSRGKDREIESKIDREVERKQTKDKKGGGRKYRKIK